MDYPQIVTTIMEGLAPISSIVDAPWVTVTSINGMTGDVVIEPIIKPFESNHYYLKDSVITYNGAICIAKQTFTSGESFNSDDWNIPDFTQEQADWNEDDSTAKSYIKNKPTIPSVNNGTLTIQKNGSNVATFSANSAMNATANISVPTKTSEITNDSGFIKSSDLPTVNDGVLTIQKNGITVDTFTANSATNKTVNIQTITAETVAPAEEVGAITASMIDWSTIVMKGAWTTTQALSSIGASTHVTIDISSLGLSSADDYVVTVTNRMISSNSWATALVVTDRTANSFTIKLFNSHWAGGTIGAGNIIDWAVFKVA